MSRRSRKALSPVVASIILIAVTVAVSIAVAAWMGALSTGFMKTEQVTITGASFQGTTNKTIQLIAKNSGTSPVTINEVWVNGAKQNYTAQSFQANAPVNVTVSYNWITNDKYEIKLVSTDGNQYLYPATAVPQPVNLNPIVTDCGSILPTFTSGGFSKYRVLGTQNIWAGTVQSVNQTGATRTWTNPGNNSAIFTYNSVDDTLKTTFNNYQLNYTSISQKTSVKPAEWNILVITIRNNSPDTTLRLDDVSLGSFSLGSFTVAPSSTNYWTVTNYDFSNGFSILGTIYLNGTFSGGSESNKILIEVGRQ
jgi:flagellin-like protein